jgi:UDP-N-acetyl-D-mannosaminuronic acid dehydrogenase
MEKEMTDPIRSVDIVLMGGGGHVGLPLGIALARSGLRTMLYDLDEAVLSEVLSGTMPFLEPGAEPLLREVIDDGLLDGTSDPSIIAQAETVIVVIGTPIDEHLNPDPWAVRSAIEAVADHLRDGQLLVLRSTVFPGSTALIEELLQDRRLNVDVAFCPERIAEGKAMTELYELPQIVSGRTDDAAARAEKLFRRLTDKIVILTPEEAELAKLFTNTWRYIKFATANQLYMIANNYGLDYERIRKGLADGYERAQDLPGAGFAAGPCLFKDTMQLAAFNDNNFTLGHAAMTVNEGLPLYLVSRIERNTELHDLTVGILGMAFKGESDDIRSSLSYKLKRILKYRAKEVLTTDPYVTVDPDLVPLEQVLEQADLLVVGAPHKVYADLKPRQEVIDIWNLLGEGVLV